MTVIQKFLATKSGFVIAFFLLFLFTPSHGFGQKLISWEALSDVSFKEKYVESVKSYLLFPNFGEQPKALQGKLVTVEGYFIPVDQIKNTVILSRYPYSSCFFCGGAGPESIVEVQLSKELSRHIRMDEKVRFQGILNLNGTDIEHFNYILKEASYLSISK